MRAAGADREVGGCRFFALCRSAGMEEKRSVFRGVDYSTKFLWKALETKGFQVSDQKNDGK